MITTWKWHSSKTDHKKARVLTSEPHRSRVAVFEQDRLIPSRGEGCVKQHPQHCEEEENDEEDLPVRSSDGHAVEGAAADQSAAQDQDVDADDAR